MNNAAQIAWKAFCQDPKEQHFEPVYEATKNLVYTICYRVLRSNEEAQDAFQGTFVRLMTLMADSNAPKPDDYVSLMARLAYLEADRLRKRRQRRARKEIVMEDTPITASKESSIRQQVAMGEMRQNLEGIVDTLPEKYRVPIVLHYFHGMTHREIAVALDRPINTISNQISRGVKKLEPKVKKAGYRDPAAIFSASLAAACLFTPGNLPAASAVFSKSSTLASVAGASAKTVFPSLEPGSASSSAGTAQSIKSVLVTLTVIAVALLSAYLMIQYFLLRIGASTSEVPPGALDSLKTLLASII